MQLDVQTRNHSYPILITNENICSFVDEYVQRFRPQKIVLGCNDTIFRLYGHDLSLALKESGISVIPLLIPEGEDAKSLACYQQLINELEEHDLTRSTHFIALGGGVTGDVVGFLAATYLRGVPFIQIPTSLLAMVDSSIGGKVGINAKNGKNRLGAFYPPIFVYITTQVLQTLTHEQWLCGLGEILKHGLLGDKTLFEMCKDNAHCWPNIPAQTLQEIVYRNCVFKRKIVEADELEEGSRSLLNFGHTVGHAIEAALSHRVPHGICVAWGLQCELFWSYKKGLLSRTVYEHICSVFSAFSFPSLPTSLHIERLLVLMQKDKKCKSNGTILCTLLHNIEEPELYAMSVQEISTLFQFPQEISA